MRSNGYNPSSPFALPKQLYSVANPEIISASDISDQKVANMTPPIAIIGAGPSGLALGRLLEVNDIAYSIFERDESATWAIGRGGTLDLHAGSGQLALQEAGLLDQFKSLARYEQTTTLADAKGTVHAVFSETGDNDRPEIDRRDLRALLLSSVPTNKVHWGLRVQHVQKEADGSMSVHFANGSTESGFRLVVGADGAWSKVRSLVSQNTTAHAYMVSVFDRSR